MALTYATTYSAGLDLPCVEDFTLKEGETREVKVQRIELGDEAGLLLPKSGLQFKKGISVKTKDVFDYIDTVTLHNFSGHDYLFKAGDSVAQLVSFDGVLVKDVPLYAEQDMTLYPGQKVGAVTQAVELEPDQAGIVEPVEDNDFDIGYGLVDADYKAPVSVLIVNCKEEPVTYYKGRFVAVMHVVKYKHLKDHPVTVKERGTNGFGSTGK